ncbi:hypothetical protein V490_07589 [Pseudogymnoascus sp. VKM F-3557]|nr:hypothetical protein V490_07589 [Pseudogymnoascus sp. VKM F-3557]
MSFDEAVKQMVAQQKKIMEGLPELSKYDWDIPKVEVQKDGFIVDLAIPPTDKPDADDKSDNEDEGEELDTKALRDFFGESLSASIEALRAVEPLEKDDFIVSTPRQHQLYAAAKLLYLIGTRFEGGMVGDTMGLGKTLSSLLVVLRTILEARAQGRKLAPWIIVTKKSLVPNWEREIASNVSEDAGLRVLILTSKHTATELYDFDIILTNFELVARQYASLRKFMDSIGKQVLPRPQCSLFSQIHIERGSGFGLVVDEAQNIKHASKTTHQACFALHRRATVLLSGTILDNHWSDVHGLVRMFPGHPFEVFGTFTKTFGSSDLKVDPSPAKVRRLQKLLMAITIIRPDDVLALPGVEVHDVHFDLTQEELQRSDHWAMKYKKAFSKGRRRNKDRRALMYVVRAVQEATHPAIMCTIRTDVVIDHSVPGLLEWLADNEGNDDDEGSEGSDSESDFEAPENSEASESEEDDATSMWLYKPKPIRTFLSRELWLESIRKEDTALESSRMKEFEDLFCRVSRKYPNERIAVTSERTKTLDIVALILQRMGMSCVRYDGRVPPCDRVATLAQFQTGDPDTHVLLITPGTGGTGLNIPEGSILIQLEVLWNLNIERQIYGRFNRQGQTKTVKVFRLVSNAIVDQIILDNQLSKDTQNQVLMGALRLTDTAIAQIPSVFEPRELDEDEVDLYAQDPAELRAKYPTLAAKKD